MRKKIYTLWYRIKDKCYNPGSVFYKNFGAKGIKLCDEWLDIDRFNLDIGSHKLSFFKGYVLGRIDYKKDFSLNNCKWMTFAEVLKQAKLNRDNK